MLEVDKICNNCEILGLHLRDSDSLEVVKEYQKLYNGHLCKYKLYKNGIVEYCAVDKDGKAWSSNPGAINEAFDTKGGPLELLEASVSLNLCSCGLTLQKFKELDMQYKITERFEELKRKRKYAEEMQSF